MDFPESVSKSNIPSELTSQRRLDRILHVEDTSSFWGEALQTESYENAEAALHDIDATIAWRRGSRDPVQRSFFNLFEGISRIKKQANASEQQELISAFMENREGACRHLPRVYDFYQSLRAELEGLSAEYVPKFEMSAKKMMELVQSGDLDILSDSNVPVSIRLDRMEKRIKGYIEGAAALDEQEMAERKKENAEKSEDSERQERPTTPPPDQNELSPSMDEMERLENGEKAPALWNIFPAYGGYYKEKSYDTWDAEKQVWKQSEYIWHDAELVKPTVYDLEKKFDVDAQLFPEQWTRIPVPYTHSIESIQTDQTYSLKQDQNGDYLIELQGGTVPKTMNIRLVPDQFRTAVKEERYEPPAAPMREVKLSEATLRALEKIDRTKKGTYKKAKAASRIVMQKLIHSNDSSFNALYRSDPDGFVAAVEKHGKADCDVGNTYFAALVSKLNISVRMCVGHMVRGKDEEGRAAITSGTGHAWCEIFDDETFQWVRIDATPPGDPNFEDLEEKEQGERVPGDYGEQEEVGPTDKELEALREKLEQHVEELSYTSEERQLAEATGIDLREAREIVKEITEAENTRLPSGEKITHVLSNVFSMIIESRKVHVHRPLGPIRKREGGEEIEDIVRHYIGIKAGESDPASRSVERVMTKEEQIFDGLEVHLIGDKSGSMQNTVDGESKQKQQRLAEYLILSALHRFDAAVKRAATTMEYPLSVQSEAISFRGDGATDIDMDKPLSNEFKPADKVKLWKSLATEGSGNGDVAALSMVYDSIKDKKDDTLKIVLHFSDGEPDDAAAVRDMAEKFGRLGIVVVGIGLTETATKVPIIFDTEYSRGDLVKDIADLPAIAAKHIVLEAIRLFPEKSRKHAEADIKRLLQKFPRNDSI